MAATPTGLAATPTGPSQITVSWNPVSGAKYALEENGIEVGTDLTATELVRTSLPNGSYDYRVRSIVPDEAATIANGSALTLAMVGTSGTLTPYSGQFIASTPGQIVENLSITGGLSIRAAGVIVRNCDVSGTATSAGGQFSSCAIFVDAGASATIEHCVVHGAENAVGFDHYTLRWSRIYGTTGDGLKAGTDTTIEYNWIKDLTPDAGSHSDGIQSQAGAENLTIRKNYIDMTGIDSNSAIFISPDFGPSSPGPVLVDANYLDGGGWCCALRDGANGTYVQSGVTITNNRFGRGMNFGPLLLATPATESGNVWDDTGAAL